MNEPKILILILTYNAERHIRGVLDRIPEAFWSGPYHADILVIDDASQDHTARIAVEHATTGHRPLRVLKNRINQGYGGNQKIGYTYAIEQGYDIVVMLHGDGQYAPESLEPIIAPLITGEADAVFGSRLLTKGGARAGGMPYYKFVGNRILTGLQNYLLDAKLLEFHTGYRAYGTSALRKIPFQYNSDDFDFDTDIIIQFLDNGLTIREVPIPTHYGEEKCHVNGLRYAFQIIYITFLSRVQPMGIYYNPKFDYSHDNSHYSSKTDFESSHRFALDHIRPGTLVLDFGCASGHIARKLRERGCRIHGFDICPDPSAVKEFDSFTQLDLGRDSFTLSDDQKCADYVLLLDVIEHLDAPEAFLLRLKQALNGCRPEILVTTGNIAFIVTRLSLLMGQFNYGKRGILDLTHKRLFTFSSLARMFTNYGYCIEKVQGIPVPFPFILKKGIISQVLFALNNALIRLIKRLFSFQIAVVARPKPTIEQLLAEAKQEGSHSMMTFPS